ncbi:MAG: universal stress protein [Helicobacteraceae bacterium]|jgi:universal stress protein E|nr:universal stress protein [Helicobacteraceae bacterium]
MQQVQQILVATDMSAMAEEALRRAIAIAKEKEAQLVVLHVIEPLFLQSPLSTPIDEEQIRQKLHREIEQLNAEAQVKCLLFVKSGKTADIVMRMADKMQIDLIVVGSHGKENINSNYFGTTTLKITQRTHIPVLIIKNAVKNSYQNIIAPTNLSYYAKESILFAETLFSKSHKKYLYAFETISKLQAMSYYLSNEEAEELRQTKIKDAAKALKNFINEVGEGEMELIEYSASINEDLLDYIKKDSADLLILGSKGVDNLNSFVFGSMASYLVQRSPIDVLVYVPPQRNRARAEA